MTTKPVVPRERAVRDVEDAVDYYIGAGAVPAAEGLIDALQSAFQLISLHPGIGSPCYGHELDIAGLRGRTLAHSPYTALYVEHTTHIDVLRVLHQHRDIPELLRDLDQP